MDNDREILLPSRTERWRRAFDEVKGHLTWRRTFLVGIAALLLTYLVLRLAQRPEAAVEEVIVGVVALVVTLVVVPSADLMWNYTARSAALILRDRLEAVEQEKKVLLQRVPTDLTIEFNCVQRSHFKMGRETGQKPLFIYLFRNVRITNLSRTDRVSLAFTYEAVVRDNDSFRRMRFGQQNGRHHLDEHVPQGINGPLNIGPQESVMGDLGFFLGTAAKATIPKDAHVTKPGPDVLEIRDHVSQLAGRIELVGRAPFLLRVERNDPPPVTLSVPML